MYLIGEFSKIAHVSSRQLRHYDQLGLLKPVYTDPTTGYRYYSAKQLPQLNRILALKEMGLSLEQIKRLLADNISLDELRGMLEMKKAQIEQMVYEELARIRRIESRIEQIDVEGQMGDYDVVVKSVPAQRYLSMREVCHSPEMTVQFASRLYQTLPSQVGQGVLGAFVMVLYSEEFDPTHLDLGLGFVVGDAVADDFALALDAETRLTVSTLPAVREMLTITRFGVNQNCYNVLAMWAEANGYRLYGQMREVVLQFAPPDSLDDLVMEIQYPAERVLPAGDVPPFEALGG